MGKTTGARIEAVYPIPLVLVDGVDDEIITVLRRHNG